MSYEKGIKQRFLKAMAFIIADRDKYGLKNRLAFTKEIGWSNSSLTRAEKIETCNIPIYCLSEIVIRYGVSAHWLLTGEGEMFMIRKYADQYALK